MPVGIHTITLASGVSPEDFEKFMTEELLPAAKTVVKIRIGMVDVEHTLVKSRTDAEGNPVYLWITDLREAGQGDFIERFPSHVGEALRVKLGALGTRTFERFAVVARSSKGKITTPTLGDERDDPDGWVGS